MNKMNAFVMLLIFWKATYKVKEEEGGGIGCAFRSKALFTEKESKDDDWIKETKEFPLLLFYIP